MNLELKRIDPIRAANISALLYACVLLVFSIILLPIAVVIIIVGSATGEPDASEAAIPLLIIAVVYPVMGLIFGWIGGLVSAFAYNLITRLTGGLKIEVAEEHLETRAAPEPPMEGSELGA